MSLRSLISTGTKIWLDSVDPDEIAKNYARGATGATSNPIIIADILKKNGHDDLMRELMDQGLSDPDIAWQMTDRLVHDAQKIFFPVWERTTGNDGYVSFELDPLIEDEENPLSHSQRVERYIALARQWADNHRNRMIKVPATPAGLDALQEIAAAGITINVTLCFTERQYTLARDAIWQGAQRCRDLSSFKSVYSIFVSRVDVYTAKHVPQLSSTAQGQVGIVNAKHLWRLNREFWEDKNLRLQQEIIFASTGAKLPGDPPDKYVQALAGSDIQTNPPETNDIIEQRDRPFFSCLEDLPAQSMLDEIQHQVNVPQMEATLMAEGLEKFASPMKQLITLIAQKRSHLASNRIV
jgi:transaldolase